MSEQLKELKAAYHAVEIPDELLLERIQQAITKNKETTMKHSGNKKRLTLLPKIIGAVAAVLALCMIPLNTIDGLAASLADIPVIGTVARVLTFRTFSESSEEHQYQVEIEVPQVSGLDNQELQSSVNAAYLTQAQEMYDHFMAEMGGLENGQLANRALEAGYEEVGNYNGLLVIRSWVVETAASAMERVSYHTIDVENGLLLTLPGLFRDDSYVEAISDAIVQEMNRRMAADENQIYWIAPDEADGFMQIDPDQTFYINQAGKLMIVFDKYAVAPGYMGVVEFEIPTEAIADLRAGEAYIH